MQSVDRKGGVNRLPSPAGQIGPRAAYPNGYSDLLILIPGETAECLYCTIEWTVCQIRGW